MSDKPTLIAELGLTDDDPTPEQLRSEISAVVEDAIRRGYSESRIGMQVAFDSAFVRKLRNGHRYKPLTLADIRNRLPLIKGPLRRRLFDEAS